MVISRLRIRAKLSPDNHGPYVVVTSYILMSVMILSTILVIARVRPNRHTLSQKPRLDECLLLLAMVIAIVEDILIEKAVDHGLGRSQLGLRADDLEIYDKMTYISKLLYVAVLCLSKMSLVIVVECIALAKWAAVSCRVLFYAVGSWGVCVTIALAFQCSLPDPWDVTPGRCIDQMALDYFIGVFNICTDLLVFIIPTVIVLKVQTTNQKRSIIIAAFAARPIASAANIVQLYTLGSDYDPLNRTQSAYVPTLWMQVVLNLSIITTCIPSLQPLFKSLHSGLMDVTLRSESLTLSPLDSRNIRMQSSSYWKMPSTARAMMESYTDDGGTITRPSTDMYIRHSK